MKSKILRRTKDQKVMWMFTITLLIFATLQTFSSADLSGRAATVIWFSILAAFILYLWIRRRYLLVGIFAILLIVGAIHTSMKFL